MQWLNEAWVSSGSSVFYLLSEQHWRVAVLAVSLWAERRQPQQEEDEGWGPHHQLPVYKRLQKCFVAVQKLRGKKAKAALFIIFVIANIDSFSNIFNLWGRKIISTLVIWLGRYRVFCHLVVILSHGKTATLFKQGY